MKQQVKYGHAAALGLAALGSGLASTTTLSQERQAAMEEVIVTSSGWEEKRSQANNTVRVLNDEALRKSSAHSLTDLLAENAAGFFSEWTPAQTSINIRGGASDGQGRDFRSQVLVLVDGRRAGTANISQMSKHDIDRVEILRGPSSVVYGSQAIGGVINLITRDGKNTRGGALNLSIGSWDMRSIDAHYGGGTDTLRFYGGIGYSSRDDYESAEGEMKNTAWKRRSGSASAVYVPDDTHRLEIAVRTDGVYDAGFRGSSWDFDNYDDRYNRSADVSYLGNYERFSMSNHLYAVEDISDFFWGAEASGTDLDHNRRELDVIGLRNSLRTALGSSTDLIAGLDLERSTLRNSRERR